MSVGCRALDVLDPVDQATIPTWLLYPAETRPTTTSFGPYSLDVAADAPIAGAPRSLVVFSHGNGGSPWTYRGLAAHLAEHGHVVALLEHPGNSRSDNRLAGTVANLERRPRHVSRAIDATLATMRVDRVAVIGHSVGAYTALALGGGKPMSLANEVDGRAHPIGVARDSRVSAFVLLAPAIDWYGAAGALAEIDAPIFVRTGELDELWPPARVDATLRSLPTPPRDHAVVTGAGHFAFQTPFPAAMIRREFPPSQEPPGFDRAGYQPILHAEVAAFLDAR